MTLQGQEYCDFQERVKARTAMSVTELPAFHFNIQQQLAEICRGIDMPKWQGAC